MIETLQAAGWQLGGAGQPATRRVAGRPAGRGVRADRSIRCSTTSRSRSPPPSGVWITDTAGRTYLDAYNNVPCVGHAHPRVTAAIARQSRLINTHTRYLHPARDRARRAAGGDVPAGARHRDARQLGVGGERPRLAHGDRRHRAARRALHRVRLPRHHRGDRRAVTRGLARRRAPRPRRDVGAARRRGAVSRGAARDCGTRRRRRSSTGSSPATASPISTPATCRSSCA